MSYLTLETVTIPKPHDATHFCPETDSDHACWYKKEKGKWVYMYADAGNEHSGKWRYNSVVDEETLSNMVEL